MPGAKRCLLSGPTCMGLWDEEQQPGHQEAGLDSPGAGGGGLLAQECEARSGWMDTSCVSFGGYVFAQIIQRHP